MKAYALRNCDLKPKLYIISLLKLIFTFILSISEASGSDILRGLGKYAQINKMHPKCIFVSFFFVYINGHSCFYKKKKKDNKSQQKRCVSPRQEKHTVVLLNKCRVLNESVQEFSDPLTCLAPE